MKKIHENNFNLLFYFATPGSRTCLLWLFLLQMAPLRSPWQLLVLLMTLATCITSGGILQNHLRTSFRGCKNMPSPGTTYYGPQAVAFNSLNVTIILYTTDFTQVVSHTSITNTPTKSQSNHLLEKSSPSRRKIFIPPRKISDIWSPWLAPTRLNTTPS